MAASAQQQVAAYENHDAKAYDRKYFREQAGEFHAKQNLVCQSVEP